MLDQIIAALQGRSDLKDWSVRHVQSREQQLYAVPTAVEARRAVESERFVVEVVCETTNADGTATQGSANTTLVPGDDITTALDNAALRAALIHNAPYGLPGPASLPDVPVADQEYQHDPATALDTLLDELRSAVQAHPSVRLTAAEFFATEQTTHLRNSRKLDATQTETLFELEMVLLSRAGEQEVESFVEMRRRRRSDLDLAAEVHRRAQYAVDTLNAVPPVNYNGPVVLRADTLAIFLTSGVFQTLASGAAKYGKVTPWEVGQSIFRGPVKGDPLTVVANRQLPFGTQSDRFDADGIAAQRVTIIQDNVLQTFIADQRYADYLNIAPTGAFGNVEVPAGSVSTADLLRDPYVEIASFSWFNPNPITGDFACEIRLGYVVDGTTRTPFKGGTFVGNFIDALANVHWSSETGFYGDYAGPNVARFGELKVAG